MRRALSRWASRFRDCHFWRLRFDEFTGTRAVDKKQAERGVDVGVDCAPRDVGVRVNRRGISLVRQRGTRKLVGVEEVDLDRSVTGAVDGESIAWVTGGQSRETGDYHESQSKPHAPLYTSLRRATVSGT